MPNKSKTIAINLLSNARFEVSEIGKIINWVLTIGKSIVLLAFLIVLSCFLYRFSLDRKIEALNDNIEINVNAINEFSDSEPQIIKLQNKLQTLTTLTETKPSFVSLLQKIENSLPVGTQLDLLNIGTKQLDFKGTAQNEIMFSSMLAALKKQPEFSGIAVDELHSGGVQNPEIKFSLKITLLDDKKQK